MFQTKITSQGTISLPAELRRKYNLKAGETVTIEDQGKIVVSKTPDFATLRKQNKKYITNIPANQSRDAGWSTHIQDTYGR